MQYVMLQCKSGIATCMFVLEVWKLEQPVSVPHKADFDNFFRLLKGLIFYFEIKTDNAFPLFVECFLRAQFVS